MNPTKLDIVREMRDMGALDAQCNDMIPRSLQALGLRTYADRLEAARKRESGNAAAMRAALSDACYAMFNFLKTQSGGYEEMAIALDKARAALAAPPRNCDRYRTEADAEAAFDRFCSKERNGQCKPWECPLKSTGGKYCYVAWLLGTEGGAE